MQLIVMIKRGSQMMQKHQNTHGEGQEFGEAESFTQLKGKLLPWPTT